MRTPARVLGHPIHQMLIPIPLGLFLVAGVLDVVQRFTDSAWIPTVSFWNAAIGVVSALVAAVFGTIDWTSIPSGTRAKRVGALHGIGNVAVVGLFAVAVYLRYDARTLPPSNMALTLEVAALMLGSVSAWLGGELVDRLGVGVDEGANVNAPNSLSHETA